MLKRSLRPSWRLPRDRLWMDIMAADGTARTSSIVKDALDIRTHMSLTQERTEFISRMTQVLCDRVSPSITPLSLPPPSFFSNIVSLTQYQAVLSASLLHADSGDHHNLR